MSSKKITDLTTYTSAELVAGSGNDLLFITDVTNNQETKKITAAEFARYSNLVAGSYTGSFTGSLTGNLNGTASFANNASFAVSASYVDNSATTNAVNTGSEGVGVFQQKIGATLYLKNISQGTNITVTDDLATNTIRISSNNLLTTPGGPLNAIQFNNPLGTFNGDANLTYIPAAFGSSPILNLAGQIIANSLTASTSVATIGFYGTSSWSNNSVNSNNSLTSNTATSASFATTASYVTNQGGILAVYNVISTTATNNNNTSPAAFAPLSITLTPKNAASKFLITISLNFFTDSGPGWATVDYYKNGANLLGPGVHIAWSDNVGNTIATTTVTISDQATDLSPRTYSVQPYVADARSNWYLNQAGTISTVTILEYLV